MKVVLYQDYGKLVMADLPIPQIKEDEVLIQVKACGICGSELETFREKSVRRTPPLVMGHEFSGVVAGIGSKVDKFNTGDRVVSNSVISCSQCIYCRKQQTHLCESRQVFGMHRPGAFAEYVAVPEKCLLRIPGNISFSEACLAEPLANGIHMLHLTKHLPLKRVMIIGAGPIGLLAQIVFQQLGKAEVIVCDINNRRLEVALQLGAKSVHKDVNSIDKLMIEEITGGEGFDIVIDAVGLAVTQEKAISIVRSGGAVVLIGLHENATVFHSYDIILPEKQVLGTYAASQQDIQEALDLMQKKKIDLTSWISYCTLDNAIDVFTDLLTPVSQNIKAVIIP